MAVGGVGNITGSCPGASVHGVRVGGVVGDSSVNLTTAGGVALALVGGGVLGPGPRA